MTEISELSDSCIGIKSSVMAQVLHQGLQSCFLATLLLNTSIDSIISCPNKFVWVTETIYKALNMLFGLLFVRSNCGIFNINNILEGIIKNVSDLNLAIKFHD